MGKLISSCCMFVISNSLEAYSLTHLLKLFVVLTYRTGYWRQRDANDCSGRRRRKPLTSRVPIIRSVCPYDIRLLWLLGRVSSAI